MASDADNSNIILTADRIKNKSQAPYKGDDKGGGEGAKRFESN